MRPAAQSGGACVLVNERAAPSLGFRPAPSAASRFLLQQLLFSLLNRSLDPVSQKILIPSPRGAVLSACQQHRRLLTHRKGPPGPRLRASAPGEWRPLPTERHGPAVPNSTLTSNCPASQSAAHTSLHRRAPQGTAYLPPRPASSPPRASPAAGIRGLCRPPGLPSPETPATPPLPTTTSAPGAATRATTMTRPARLLLS